MLLLEEFMWDVGYQAKAVLLFGEAGTLASFLEPLFILPRSSDIFSDHSSRVPVHSHHWSLNCRGRPLPPWNETSRSFPVSY
jgi:hypothetical protein